VKAKDRKMHVMLDVDLPLAALRSRRRWRRFRLGHGSDVVATAAHVDEAGILLSDHCKGCARCNLGVGRVWEVSEARRLRWCMWRAVLSLRLCGLRREEKRRILLLLKIYIQMQKC
jgi:hypothetical protein